MVCLGFSLRPCVPAGDTLCRSGRALRALDYFTVDCKGQGGKLGRGELPVGKGGPPDEVYRTMLESGELAEGYYTLKLGKKWLQENYPEIQDDLPLFFTLHDIIFGDIDPMDGLTGILDGLS